MEEMVLEFPGQTYRPIWLAGDALVIGPTNKKVTIAPNSIGDVGMMVGRLVMNSSLVTESLFFHLLLRRSDTLQR